MTAREYRDPDKLDTNINQNFWRYVATSLLIGLMLGIGVGLGVESTEIPNSILSDSFVKLCIIGLTIGLLGGFFSVLGLLPLRVSKQQREFYKEHTTLAIAITVVSSTVFVLLIFGIPLGLNESMGAGLRAGAIAGFVTMLIASIAIFFSAKAQGVDYRLAGLMAAQTALILGIPLGIFAGLDSGATRRLPEAFAGSLGVTVGLLVGAVFGTLIGYLLRPVKKELPELNRYLWAMRWPVITFALGYAAIVLLFAGFYSAASHVDGAFVGAPVGTFSDFFIYSLLTATSVGDETIMANALWAKALVAFELVLGIAWIVVGFAGVVAYLEPRFASIRTVERDKALIRQLIDGVFADRNPDTAADLLAPGHVVYDENNPEGTNGHAWFEFHATTFPQLEFDVDTVYQTVKDDHVVTRWNLRWKERGEPGEYMTYPVRNIDCVSGGQIVATYTTLRVD